MRKFNGKPCHAYVIYAGSIKYISNSLIASHYYTHSIRATQRNRHPRKRLSPAPTITPLPSTSIRHAARHRQLLVACEHTRIVRPATAPATSMVVATIKRAHARGIRHLVDAVGEGLRGREGDGVVARVVRGAEGAVVDLPVRLTRGAGAAELAAAGRAVDAEADGPHLGGCRRGRWRWRRGWRRLHGSRGWRTPGRRAGIAGRNIVHALVGDGVVGQDEVHERGDVARVAVDVSVVVRRLEVDEWTLQGRRSDDRGAAIHNVDARGRAARVAEGLARGRCSLVARLAGRGAALRISASRLVAIAVPAATSAASRAVGPATMQATAAAARNTAGSITPEETATSAIAAEEAASPVASEQLAASAAAKIFALVSTAIGCTTGRRLPRRKCQLGLRGR